MEVKDAVRIAKAYIADLYSEEKINQIGLEEVEFDDDAGEWQVTVGFRRPWSKPSERKGDLFANFTGFDYQDRWYKRVGVLDSTGKVIYVRDRELKSAA